MLVVATPPFTSMKNYMRTQSGEKPFAYKQCSYSCSVAESLKTHIRTHSGEKQFACKPFPNKCQNQEM